MTACSPSTRDGSFRTSLSPEVPASPSALGEELPAQQGLLALILLSELEDEMRLFSRVASSKVQLPAPAYQSADIKPSRDRPTGST